MDTTEDIIKQVILKASNKYFVSMFSELCERIADNVRDYAAKKVKEDRERASAMAEQDNKMAQPPLNELCPTSAFRNRIERLRGLTSSNPDEGVEFY